jgi:hypothetical protein
VSHCGSCVGSTQPDNARQQTHWWIRPLTPFSAVWRCTEAVCTLSAWQE